MEEKNILEVIKRHTRLSLKGYNQIIQKREEPPNEKENNIALKVKDLKKKIEERKKEDTTISQNRISNKQIITIEQSLENNCIERRPKRDNSNFPKVHINLSMDKFQSPRRQSNARDSAGINLSFNSNQETTQGIISLYGEQSFHPTPILKNDDNDHDIQLDQFSQVTINNENKEELISEKQSIIDNDHNLDPFFFSNRYLEYEYIDHGDKFYDHTDILRNLFEANVKRDIEEHFFSKKKSSPFLPLYNKLIEEEEKEPNFNDEESEIQFTEQSEVEGKEEDSDILSIEEKKRIERIVSEIKSRNEPEEEFKSFFFDKIKKFNINQEEQQQIGGNIQRILISRRSRKNELVPIKPINPIAFGMEIQGEVIKKNKLLLNKIHRRGIIVQGPTAFLYTTNMQKELGKEVGYFDIRNGEYDHSEQEEELNAKREVQMNYGYDKTDMTYNEINYNDKKNEDDTFEIKKYVENGKEINESLILISTKVEEFNNKSFMHLFSQLKSYYNDLQQNIDNAQYNHLKYLSDPNMEFLEIYTEANAKLIDYIIWHPKLKNLTIPIMFIKNLLKTMKSDAWQCQLTSLSIIKDSSMIEFDKDLIALFQLQNSIYIQNIHFISIPFNDSIKEALITHINTFYYYKEKLNKKYIRQRMRKETINDQLFIFLNNTIPILNLSIKKPPNSSESKSTDDVIDLKGIYSLLIFMLAQGLKFTKGSLPEVFNCLDLSEIIVKNPQYLVKIITKFKIIKELNLSNTKLENYIKVIESKNFLSSIELMEHPKILDDAKEELYKIYEEEYKNIGTENEEKELGYDFTMDILPLLERIYLFQTDLREDISYEIYSLFKRLKFFQEFYYSSSQANKSNEDLHPFSLTSKFPAQFIDQVDKNKDDFCDNFFTFSNE